MFTLLKRVCAFNTFYCDGTFQTFLFNKIIIYTVIEKCPVPYTTQKPLLILSVIYNFCPKISSITFTNLMRTSDTKCTERRLVSNKKVQLT